MTKSPAPLDRRPYLPLMLASGVVIVLDSIIDWLVGSFPFVVSSVEWRFGFVGVFGTRVGPILIAELIMVAALIGLGSRVALRWVGFLHLASTVLIALATISFLLDGLQLQSGVSNHARPVFGLASLRAFGALVLLGWLTGWLGVVLLKRAGPKVAARSSQVLVGDTVPDR